ncbi:HAD family hydrolase [Vibrio cortegadensis]|uniref:HAD family hydrolase n=1 Tax=Vibrio cortegadensis TaxID=1328770 RepID=UPI00352EC1DB
MIKALLFDMDGLIFDTEWIYKESWQYATHLQGFELSDELYYTFIGVQDKDCERLLTLHVSEKIDLDMHRNTRNAYFNSMRDSGGIKYKLGFHALFSTLKSKNLQCALVTSSPRSDVERNFEGSLYLGQFDAIITADSVAQGKPSPDGYLKAIQQLGIAPETCLVLEDSNNGVLAGLKAGCITAMIPDLLGPRPDIEPHIHYILRDLESAIGIIDSDSVLIYEN